MFEHDGPVLLENNLSAPGLLQDLPQLSSSSARKRAPKAPTMSAKRWRPAEDRIKELYVHEDKSIKQLRDIVNGEFDFEAK